MRGATSARNGHKPACYDPRVLSVGFDGRALVSPAAGVRRYAYELFGALAALSRLRVIAIGAPPDAALPPGVERGPLATSLPTNPGWMLTGLPRAARRARLNLFHAPSYTAPVAGPRPLVLTIHDVSYQRHPEWYPHRRDPLRRGFYRWSARAADRIITDSSFSKAEILAAYHLSPDILEVVPLAAASGFEARGSRSLPDGVVPPYVLHVGDLHPRRNLEIVARAVLQVRRRGPEHAGLQLVLAGVDRGIGQSLTRLADRSQDARGSIRLLGDEDDVSVGALYRGAAALVYPSRYEGFGLPLLEAMASGTPVIASNAASIPEVTGDAGVLLDPDDENGWARAIQSVLESPDVAAGLREAGLRRAALFSWRRTAEATLEVYERALAARGR
jgi:O-antigen biosynthesis alpha-1,3-rhamnosyltransferase